MFEKNQVKQIIKKLYPESTVYLFGAYARNEQTTQSDIDLFVLFDGELEIHQRKLIQSNIRKELANFYIAADVLAAGKEEFKQNSILTNHIFSNISKEGVL